MLKGGGKLVVAASGHYVGPGHFGLIDLGDGVQKFSCHYEADLVQGGHSVLGIRPLLWQDGWPVSSDNFREGIYEIQSERSGYALELAVDFVRMAGGMRFFGGKIEEPIVPVHLQKLADVEKGWPKDNIDLRIGDYMGRPHQKWNITPVQEAGGYFGSPYFKIIIEGTNRALAATAGKEVITVPGFTGAPEQLWQIDQLTDGTYRIMPKAVPGSHEQLALTAVGRSTPTLARFDSDSYNARWSFKRP
jgi:arabinan endo-1,5-alpha-L-arabinosidase